MKTLSWTERTNNRQTNIVKEKISLLSQKGFLWREIAELTDLPKKLIKGIAKGEYIPSEEESDRLSSEIDNAIERLRNSMENNNEPTCPEQDIDAEDYKSFKVEVKSVSIYKGTDDDKMIIQIHGIKLHD